MLNFYGTVATILKMATGRKLSMSGFNSEHHYLPTYQILMISDNVEFLPTIFMRGGVTHNFESRPPKDHFNSNF